MLEERVSERVNLLNSAYEADDYESIAAMYTDDSKIISADYGVFEGPEGAAAYCRAGREKVGIMKMTYELLAVDQLDDLITGFGRCTYYDANDISMGTSWFMTAFREVDGQLKFYRDMGF